MYIRPVQNKKMKPETINGKLVTFHKKVKYHSKDFPSVPYVEARHGGKIIAIGDSKEKLLKDLKRK